MREYDRRDVAYRAAICFIHPESTAAFAPECSPPAASYTVWGDSHAAALSVGFRAYADGVGQYTGGRCAPMLDFDSWDNANCLRRNAQAAAEIARIRPEVVVMLANWSGYLDNPGAQAALEHTLDRLLAVDQDLRVQLVGSVPQWHPSLPEVYVRSGRALVPGETFKVEGLLLRRLRNFDDVLARIASARDRVHFVSLIDVLCNPQGACLSAVASDGRVETVVWDYGHLTELGSIETVQRLVAHPSFPADAED